MSRYGQLGDYVAGVLGVAATLVFAYAWDSANIVVGGLAASGRAAAVAVVVYQHFLHDGRHRRPVDVTIGMAMESMASPRNAHKRN